MVELGTYLQGKLGKLTRPAQAVRKAVFVPPHEYLRQHQPWYERWHNHRWHNHVHYGVLAIFVLALVFNSHLASASGSWTQTDWSGGVGASTSTQYSAASNVDTSIGGQAALTSVAGWSPTYTAWSKRQSVTITNTGSAQTDYQVKLSITYDSDMNADFSDLRFTNSSGTVLPYWVETKTDSTSATVWVKVDSLGGNTTTDIYMYYGNASATTASDGNNVFLLFDDFSSGSIDTNKWTLQNNTNLQSIVSGELNIGPGSQAWNQAIYSTAAFPRSDLSFEMKYRWPTNIPSYDALMMGWDDGGASYANLVYGYYNDGNCSSPCPIQVYESANYRGVVTGGFAVGTQYLTRIRMRASGGAYYEQSSDGGQTWTLSYTSTFSTATNLHPGWALYSGTHIFDDVRVRKWMTTEPTSSYSAEVQQVSSSGTLTSAIFDAGVQSDWGTLSFNTTLPAGTTLTVKVRSGNAADLSDATAFGSCSTISSGSDATTACAPDKTRYAQYLVTFTGPGTSTPTLQDITLGYAFSDLIPPTTNASAVVMKASPTGAAINSNDWTNAATPYFSWTAGVDDVGGSGIKGYCLYLGQDNTADPITTKGLLGTSPVDTAGACQFAVAGNSVDLSTSGYIGTAMSTSNSAYYLSVKALDNAGNVYNGSSAQFHFRFDNTPPTNPTFVTAPSQFVSSKDVTLTWPINGNDAPFDNNSGLVGLQYRIGSTGTWYGDSHTGAQDTTDLLTNDGSYETISNPDYTNLSEGNNIVYFRTWDLAGNYSPGYVTTVIKLNTSSPSSPQNVTPSPTINTTNSFAFSWLAPASFTGSAANLTYCYTINAVPNSSNCTYTAAGVTSLPAGAYATQPGDNTIYVVAKDEAGNINYATAASATFNANTAAPGVPLNLDIADISVKATSNWKLALSWEEPTDVGAGVASYKVYRSTNGTSFSQVASTSGTSSVDGGLSQLTYYYKVKACDSANNCGAFTNVVSKLPTGKFTSPATLVSGPSASASNRKATINWTTDRTSDSRIQYGTQTGQYFATEAASSDQVVAHSIQLTNLNPGTTYYYKAKWTDEDGNIGLSSEKTFTTLPAPSVKEVTVLNLGVSSATINFISKEAVQVKLYYGKSEGFGGVKTLNTSQAESTYSIALDSLDDGSKYFFKINTLDSDGNEYDGNIYSLETPARPHITNLRFQPVANEPTSTQSVTWTTNVPTTSELTYGVVGGSTKDALDTKLVTDHQMIIRELLDNSQYSLVASSRDAGGNLATSDTQVFKTALDTRPPAVTNIEAEPSIRGTGAEATGQIIVSWHTDEPATSQVAYGEGSGGSTYTNKTNEDATLSFDHVVIVSNLPTSKVFHFQPMSKDASGNQGLGEDQSTIIGKATDSVLSIIFNALQNIFGFKQ